MKRVSGLTRAQNRKGRSESGNGVESECRELQRAEGEDNRWGRHFGYTRHPVETRSADASAAALVQVVTKIVRHKIPLNLVTE